MPTVIDSSNGGAMPARRRKPKPRAAEPPRWSPDFFDPIFSLARDPVLKQALIRSARAVRHVFPVPHRPAAGAPRRMPARESLLYLNLFAMCHRRHLTLLAAARGELPRTRQEADQIASVVEILETQGLAPADFGFIDPPAFDPAHHANSRSVQ